MSKWYQPYINSIKKACGEDYVYTHIESQAGNELDTLTVTSVGNIEVIMEWYFEEPKEGNQGRIIIRMAKDLNSLLRKRIFGWYIGIHKQITDEFNLTIQVTNEKSECIRTYRVGESQVLTGLFGNNREDIRLVINRGKVNRAEAIEVVKQITYELINEGWIGDE